MKKSIKWIGYLLVGTLCTGNFYGCGNETEVEKVSITEKESETSSSDELLREIEQLEKEVKKLFSDEEQKDLDAQITDTTLKNVDEQIKKVKEKADPEQKEVLEKLERELIMADKMYAVKEIYENLYSSSDFMEYPEITKESLESGKATLEELKVENNIFYEKYEKLFAEEEKQLVVLEEIREKILKLWDMENGKLKDKATKKSYEKVKKEVEKIENPDIREIFSETLVGIETALTNSKPNGEKEKDTKKEAEQDVKTETKKESGTKEKKKPGVASKPVKQPESRPKPTEKPKTEGTSKPTETYKPTETPKPTATPEPPACEHTWVAQKEVQVVEPAWDEPIYEMRAICSCGADITGNIDMHYADGCGGGYSVEEVQVGSIHHDAVTKEVIMGYVCSGCGARK